MSFKIFFLVILCLLAGCGVKARPAVPTETAIQSYLEKYTTPEEAAKLNPSAAKQNTVPPKKQ